MSTGKRGRALRDAHPKPGCPTPTPSSRRGPRAPPRVLWPQKHLLGLLPRNENKKGQDLTPPSGRVWDVWECEGCLWGIVYLTGVYSTATYFLCVPLWSSVHTVSGFNRLRVEGEEELAEVGRQPAHRETCLGSGGLGASLGSSCQRGA